MIGGTPKVHLCKTCGKRFKTWRRKMFCINCIEERKIWKTNPLTSRKNPIRAYSYE